MKIYFTNQKSRQQIFLILISILLLISAQISPIAFIQLVLYLLSYLLVGFGVIKNAVINIFNRDFFGEEFLMTIATIGAFLIAQYPEAIAVMLFYRIGEMFNDAAIAKSKNSIADMLSIRANIAHLFINDKTQDIKPELLKINDHIIVNPGEKIPVDSIVVAGAAYLDTKALTGESKPNFVTTDDYVLSGTIVTNSPLRLLVIKEYKNSTVSKILQLVQEASNKKTQTETFITSFSKIYTPIVVFLAILLTVIPVLLSQPLETWLYRSLMFLVISCPCALVISVPLSYFGGIGAASKNGVLIKGSNYLELLNSVDTFVFDKTGTLTKGAFSVYQVIPNQKISKDKLLALIAAIESVSPHPIAKSIVSYNTANDIQFTAHDIKELVGLGVSGYINNTQYFVGSAKLMKQLNLSHNLPLPTIGSLVYLADKNNYYGAIEVADTIRTNTIAMLMELKKAGIKKNIMLTGDNYKIATAVTRQLVLDDVKAELLPQDKVKELSKIKQQTNNKVAFVGDGLNDTPVLALADIGIAMGGLGSDAAIEAADIVLMKDDPLAIAKVLQIAKKTRLIVLENITLAILVKLIFLGLGVLGITTMWEAVFSDVGVTLLTVINTLRLLTTNYDNNPPTPMAPLKEKTGVSKKALEY